VKTVLVKRFFYIVIVLLMAIPSIGVMNAGDVVYEGDNTYEELIANKTNEIIQAPKLSSEIIPEDKMSMEVAELLNRYSPEDLNQNTIEYLTRFNEKMLERRRLMTRECPTLPYIPVDATKNLMQRDPSIRIHCYVTQPS